MRLLDIFRKNNKDDFIIWLDKVFEQELPKSIKAICFNLYDDGNNKWSVELVGAASFDKENPDWACDEAFTTRDNPYVLNMESNWENILNIFINKVNQYLKSGKYSKKIKEYDAVAIGFVDGDLDILYKK